MRQHFFILIMVLMGAGASAQVGINTETPATSAALDVTSTEKGFLPPRMTGAQRDAITSPATGLIVFCTDCGIYGEAQIYNSISWTNLIGGEASLAVPNVTNPTTGVIWMDRNLGATQVATSSTDAASYGDLYQWGRGTDGHEKRTSLTTTINATTAAPNEENSWDGKFITENTDPYDWLSPQVHTLWQGANGTNNPCPSGYRLPTIAEWDAERESWDTNNSAGAFDSPLKLPVAGYRFYSNGSLNFVGTEGNYWSSTVSSTNSRSLFFNSSNANMTTNYRTYGRSVRCLKD